MSGADGHAATARAAITFDHLAVAAETLEAGAAFLAARLGVAPDPGGAHPRMGTHNRLLSLGPEAYLELIAIDPAAPPPDRPRWFGLDEFRGAPRLVGWVARTTALHPAPGTSLSAQSRGDLRWQIALPEDGRPMAGGALPMLIDWQGGTHPAERLPDRGLRLARLALGFAGRWPDWAATSDPRIEIGPGAVPLRALIETPRGAVWL